MAPQSQQRAGATDLLDFGQSSTPKPRAAPNPQAIQSQDIPSGLQQPLQPEMGAPIKRQDTITSDVDEFVDAKS